MLVERCRCKFRSPLDPKGLNPDEDLACRESAQPRRSHATSRHQRCRRASASGPIHPSRGSDRGEPHALHQRAGGIASDGSVPEDAEAQCALAWRNLQAQLRAAGMEIENLVKIATVVRDLADIAKVRTGRAAVLGTHRAAGTLIIGGLSNPAWKVEVEGIAVA